MTNDHFHYLPQSKYGLQTLALTLVMRINIPKVKSMNNVFRWNDRNEDHIGEHGVLPQEAEYVVDQASAPYPDKIGHGKWLVRGQAPDGRFIQAIFIIEDGCYYVIHARGLTDKEKRQLRRRRR